MILYDTIRYYTILNYTVVIIIIISTSTSTSITGRHGFWQACLAPGRRLHLAVCQRRVIIKSGYCLFDVGHMKGQMECSGSGSGM